MKHTLHKAQCPQPAHIACSETWAITGKERLGGKEILNLYSLRKFFIETIAIRLPSYVVKELFAFFISIF